MCPPLGVCELLFTKMFEGGFHKYDTDGWEQPNKKFSVRGSSK